MQNKKILFIGTLIMFLILLSGCFQGEQSLKEIDVPQNSDTDNDTAEEENQAEDDLADTDAGQDVIMETVPRQLYLMDVNGMIVEQTLELPLLESKEVATQVLTYLIKDGPVTSILPNGFQAVLPAETEILGLNLLDDGTIIVDVSEEFTDYRPEDELKILQAMTYTLTQFENINKLQLRINGEPQQVMPVNGTPIGDGYSRSNGINIISTDNVDLLNSQAVTMYFPTEYNDSRYYVPITKHIKVDEADPNMLSSIVQSLIEGPGYQTNLIHVFNMDTTLMEVPVLEDGILELVFNESILKDKEKAVISDEVMETLVRTLTEHQNVEAIEVKVENVEVIVNENGEQYDEPVTSSLITKDRL